MLSWVMDIEEYERREDLLRGSNNAKPVKRCSLILRILFAILVIVSYPFIAAVVSMFLLGVLLMISAVGR